MSELVFQIEEDPVDGGWVARALGVGITTQADDLDELKAMIRDALRCHYDRPEDLPTVIRLHYVRDEVMPLVPQASSPRPRCAGSGDSDARAQ